MPFSRERTCGIVQLVRFRFRRIAGKDRVIPQLASRDQRAARRVVDRAGDASRVLPQLPTRTYFPRRLCVTEGVHFFVRLPIFRYKLWLRGVWGDPARSMLMELHSSNYIPVLGLWVILLNRCRNANRGLAAWKTVRKCTIRMKKNFFLGVGGPLPSPNFVTVFAVIRSYLQTCESTPPNKFTAKKCVYRVFFMPKRGNGENLGRLPKICDISVVPWNFFTRFSKIAAACRPLQI